MSQAKPELETTKKPFGKAIGVGITLIVALIIIVSLLTIYVDPRYSWSPSIRDSDGDSVSDGEDEWPDDPLKAVPIAEASSSYSDEVWTIAITGVRDADGETSVPADETFVCARGGFYGEDFLPSTTLDTIIGQASHSVEFLDSDGDDGLSEGDSLRLEMPAYAAGSEICLTESRTSPFGAGPLSHCYLLLDDASLDTPIVSADVVSYSGGWTYVFSSPQPPAIHWGEVGFSFQSYSMWHLHTDDLTGGYDKTIDLGGHYVDIYTLLYTTVTDLSGDGEIDDGDRFTIRASSSNSEPALYNIDVIYLPTGEPMFTAGCFYNP